jgi:DNA-binding NarL/FixJ family response regulator
MDIKLKKTLKMQLEPELEIMALVAQGKTNEAIAKEVFVSVHTVKAHVAKVLRILDAKDRTQAVYKLTKLGLI